MLIYRKNDAPKLVSKQSAKGALAAPTPAVPTGVPTGATSILLATPGVPGGPTQGRPGRRQRSWQST